MPFRYLKLRQLYKRIFAALLVGITLLLWGGVTITWQTVSELRQDSESHLQQAKLMFDRILGHASQVAANVEGLSGYPCSPETAMQLREQVLKIPDIRSANLAIDRRIYCTSLHGEYDGPFEPDNYVDGKLRLLSGNVTTPDRPLILLHHKTGKGSVLVGVDGYYLRNVLDIARKSSLIVLVIGDRALLGSGKVEAAPSPATLGYMALSSANYPYKVATIVTNNDYLNHAWRYSRNMIILFPLLAFLVGFGTFWLMGRSTTPTEELKRALSQQEFIPYLQPVVTCDDERLHGCEVLMRWQHPRQGMISPDRFISLAEDSGLIVPMTSQLMAQVRDYFSPQVSKLPVGFHFSFNICASHCKDLSLVADCRAFIQAFKDNPIKLVLELTERNLIVANEVTEQLFTELHQLGVMIAIDDFGTGHSSLTYLQQFQVDVLKIDQSFVGMISTDALSSHIVENVIDLASRLDLQLVAEGVENQAQADYLKVRNVDYLQGYFYGRPVPMKEFSKRL
ncbi:EAL domain-containing protein [Aeromonas veronii]|uniref:EAL domain-containing protein n=1 Tax=Aeromonas veronii TaxID=654 RepID=UPI001317F80F|nr:cyclic diguanylate phosphodiesterase [Aeromonas veronii]QHC06663.1 EAL domain-containing protein [Aeromonas veronii]